MEVAAIREQIEMLNSSADAPTLAGEIVADRNIKPLLTILQKFIDELNKSDPDQRRLHRLTIEAHEHWGNMAQAVLRDNSLGQEISSRELSMVAESKLLIDELVKKADEKRSARRDRASDALGSSVDSNQATEQHAPMTDLTRQEVDAKLAQNKADVDARLANFDASIKTGFAEARAEAAELRADMHKMHAEIKSWTLATMITIIGTMLAAIFGVATIFNNASKSAAPAQAPQPVVIYAQPASVSAPQAPVTAQPSAK